jgi:hypothetical protein
MATGRVLISPLVLTSDEACDLVDGGFTRAELAEELEGTLSDGRARACTELE